MTLLLPFLITSKLWLSRKLTRGLTSSSAASSPQPAPLMPLAAESSLYATSQESLSGGLVILLVIQHIHLSLLICCSCFSLGFFGIFLATNSPHFLPEWAPSATAFLSWALTFWYDFFPFALLCLLTSELFFTKQSCYLFVCFRKSRQLGTLCCKHMLKIYPGLVWSSPRFTPGSPEIYCVMAESFNLLNFSMTVVCFYCQRVSFRHGNITDKINVHDHTLISFFFFFTKIQLLVLSI